MKDEREIGRIIFVDSFRIIAEIDKDIKSFTKSFYTGIHPVARINSYIVIPVGNQKIIAIVTKVTITEENKEISPKGIITLPEAKRLLHATMIGRIENNEYYQGITSFPSLDNPVWVILPEELDIIFDKKSIYRGPKEKSYYIPIGESTSFPGYEIKINPDALFSKHLAVLGNTGAGKSCTIASLIQAILSYKEENKKVENAHFIILDTNGEYRRAFHKENGEKIGNYLYIGPENLKIPYWFLNFDDFVYLFKPKEGVQMPVLGTALSLAKKASLYDLKSDRIPTELEQQIDVDIPVYFEKEEFLKTYLERAIELEGGSSSRISEYCATMKVRINRFFNDERYRFLFDNFPKHPHALATFLRYILGMLKNSKYNPQNEDKLTAPEEFPPYFAKEVIKAIKENGESDFFTNHQVVIIDLNLLAREILENVTALIGRLILEFLQRVAKENKELRGKFPVVLVLEEAHNYIPERTKGDKESVSKIIFERIAREGRKFGLSLVISSQRPSELSRTVLSQCNSFIIHRIQNPEDQQYIKSIVPSINQDLINQLPVLAQQTALIFGDCVRSPALVRIREANPLPQSDDPEFFKHWIGEAGPEEPPFEDVCRKWEGGESEHDS